MYKLEKGMFTTVPILCVEGQSPYTQTLYTWMCKYSNDDGQCRPSMKTLSSKTGMSKSMIIKSIKKLEELGLILKTNRFKEGEYTSNMYDVYINNVQQSGSAQSTPPSVQSTPPSVPQRQELKQLTKSSNTNNIYMSENASTHTQSSIADEDKKPTYTNKGERFEEFWKTFPHPRTAKKKDALDFYRRSCYSEEEILFESRLLELKIKYGLEDIKRVKGCALWTRDLVKTPSVVLEKIIKQIVYAHMKNPQKIREDVELLISVFGKEKIMQYNKEYNKEFNSITFNLT